MSHFVCCFSISCLCVFRVRASAETKQQRTIKAEAERQRSKGLETFKPQLWNLSTWNYFHRPPGVIFPGDLQAIVLLLFTHPFERRFFDAEVIFSGSVSVQPPITLYVHLRCNIPLKILQRLLQQIQNYF